jgi:glycosyltransferase involved in cell wall biosynthesis
MKVVIASSTVPFDHGGGARIVDWLEEALVARGHEVDVLRLPVHSTAPELPKQLVGMRLYDLTGHGDRLITIRTPAHLVRHHDKVAWFIHHHRPAYDQWEHYRDVPDDGSGWEFRRMMHASDEVAFAECRHVFTNSRTMTRRLRDHNGVASEVLYPPVGESAARSLGRGGPLGDAVVCVARLVRHKRQLLLARAMRHVRSGVRLVIAGASDPHYADEIRREIADAGTGDRVTFLEEVVSERRKVELLRSALAVAFLPFDEDSYGYSGLEAAMLGRPLLTTSDSGGVLELVEDGVNGLVTAPDPVSLAAALDRLHEDRALAGRMGAAQTARLAALRVDWDHVVDRLLS